MVFLLQIEVPFNLKLGKVLAIAKERCMSLKTKLILVAGVLAAIGIGIGLELHRLHRRILEELVAIRQQGER